MITNLQLIETKNIGNITHNVNDLPFSPGSPENHHWNDSIYGTYDFLLIVETFKWIHEKMILTNGYPFFPEGSYIALDIDGVLKKSNENYFPKEIKIFFVQLLQILRDLHIIPLFVTHNAICIQEKIENFFDEECAKYIKECYEQDGSILTKGDIIIVEKTRTFLDQQIFVEKDSYFLGKIYEEDTSNEKQKGKTLFDLSVYCKFPFVFGARIDQIFDENGFLKKKRLE